MDSLKNTRSLLKRSSNSEWKELAEAQLKDLVIYFKEEYSQQGKFPIQLETALQDMGVMIVDGLATNKITILGDKVSFITKERKGTPEYFKEISRLLTIYLFTSKFIGSTQTEWVDEKLSTSEEEIVQLMYILLLIPSKDTNQFISMTEIVKISILNDIPVPVLRRVLSV